ncbi:MAG: Phosphomannomutase [Berkelbacteria bacterium GW2011_GWA2_38_9]|uniref:Phosphomannomutase n=1 Tax=Berkelbacteria bacterium GW2011_GWA2_38_9 TaxID=1618334 RepID=A0A0G0NVU2_9BACT|nr:MAG: Phosphomannomutase [Berkelbacteria bacterium GW2011_GWA2_38_9]
MNIDQSIFKAYDIRGTVPDQINPKVAEQIGRAFAGWLSKVRANGRSPVLKVIVGRDVRTHSPEIAGALIRGIASQSIDVVDVGLITTPMLYFIDASAGFDGGVSVTASHNPAEYNGFKIVREKAIAISGDSGIKEIGQMATSQNFPDLVKGQVTQEDFTDRYIDHLQTFINFKDLKPAKIVVNPNFGVGSNILKKLANIVPGEFVYLNSELDGSFPKGKPDPLLPVNRTEISELIKSTGADFGVSWDADGDRVYFLDQNGEFIDGYFTTAVLAEAMLKSHPGSKIIYDPRLTWATIDTVNRNGGIPIVCKPGHSFFKQRMRSEDALFAGEMSGHYYFRDNFYADDGMLAFLIIWDLYTKKNCQYSDLVKDLKAKYITAGQEFNFEVQDSRSVLAQIEENYTDSQKLEIDGLTIEYPDWRFNLRPSNTEPLIRLNIEAKSQITFNQKLQEITDLIKQLGGVEK